jgi:hypothetical protein
MLSNRIARRSFFLSEPFFKFASFSSLSIYPSQPLPYLSEALTSRLRAGQQAASLISPLLMSESNVLKTFLAKRREKIYNWAKEKKNGRKKQFPVS